MSRWQAVVFDLDDTIYPERDFVFGGFRAVAHWLALQLDLSAQTVYDQLRSLYEASVRGKTFDLCLQALGVSDTDLVPVLVQVYRDHTPQLESFPEVIPMLTELRSRYRLGLVSDGYLAVQQRKLEALGLAPYFDAIVFSDQWGRDAWKPSTRPFEAVLEQLDALPDTAIYVADNPLKDFLGARRIGMWTVQIQRPGGEYVERLPPTPRHAPHATIYNLEQLMTLLDTSQEGCS